MMTPLTITTQSNLNESDSSIISSSSSSTSPPTLNQWLHYSQMLQDGTSGDAKGKGKGRIVEGESEDQEEIMNQVGKTQSSDEMGTIKADHEHGGLNIEDDARGEIEMEVERSDSTLNHICTSPAVVDSPLPRSRPIPVKASFSRSRLFHTLRRYSSRSTLASHFDRNLRSSSASSLPSSSSTTSSSSSSFVVTSRPRAFTVSGATSGSLASTTGSGNGTPALSDRRTVEAECFDAEITSSVDNLDSWKSKGKERMDDSLTTTQAATADSSSSSLAPALSPGLNRGDGSNTTPSADEMTTRPQRHRLRSHSAPLLQLRVASPLSLPLPRYDSYSSITSQYTTALSSPALFAVNHFEGMLPRELQLKIVGSLVDVCEDDLEQEKREGVWRGERCREKQVGKLRGIREIIKISRVSRSFRLLALDGHHWSVLSSSFGAPQLSLAQLVSIASIAATCVKTLDLRGMRDASNVDRLTTALAGDVGHLMLTTLALTGCSSISSVTLDRLCGTVPHLRIARFQGVSSVTAATISTLARTATRLRELDVNQCSRLYAIGLLGLPISSKSEVEKREEGYRGIEVIRASSILQMTDVVLCQIGRRYYDSLIVLDISYSKIVTDQGFLNLVATSPAGPTRSFRLRHLNLTGCLHLTDAAFSYLAGSVDELEFFECARIGGRIQSKGLIALFDSTPLIRGIDLEDCTRISDDVLYSLIRPVVSSTTVYSSSSRPSRLQHLIISSCTLLSDSAISSVVRESPELVRLEADATAITEETAKAFIIKLASLLPGIEGRKRNREDVGDIGLLSILDTQRVGRRLNRDLNSITRTRAGVRDHSVASFGYHDGTPAIADDVALRKDKMMLQECSREKVVVRSFFGSLTVDLANALRAETTRKEMERRAGGSVQSGGSCVIN